MDGQSLREEVVRLLEEQHQSGWMREALERSVQLAEGRSQGRAISMRDIVSAFACIMGHEAEYYRDTFKIGYSAAERPRRFTIDDDEDRRWPTSQRRKRRR